MGGNVIADFQSPIADLSPRRGMLTMALRKNSSGDVMENRQLAIESRQC